tara:strand:- start:10227 stop:10433 length:207 start_codon:yes stop_codon:yes gene_type:complete
MWFCNTEEAKRQMRRCEARKCPGCRKCIWIEESANAMSEYGKVIEPPTIDHPLLDYIIEKFNGVKIGS